MMSKSLQIGLVLVAATAMVSARGQNAVESGGSTAGVEQALGKFLTAFDNLDWPRFRACFSPDATMFHPAAPNVKRIDTPQDFEKAWLGVFARIKRTSGRDTPPYMNLAPQDVKIDMLSPQIGLVSFHLFEGATISRRTLIFQHFSDGWKIVHLHASNIVTTTATDQAVLPTTWGPDVAHDAGGSLPKLAREGVQPSAEARLATQEIRATR